MYTITPTPLAPKRPEGFRIPFLVACSLLSILVMIVAAGAITGITHVRGSAHQAVTVDGQLSRWASVIATQTLESRRYEKDFFLNIAEPPARADYLAKWHVATTALNQAIVAFAAAATTPDDQQQAARWHQEVAQYTQDFGQIAQAVTDGHLSNAQAANDAFMPFKENIRVLTESSVTVANHEAMLAIETSATLDATGTRTTWLVGLLAALALSIAVGYGLLETVSFRHSCIDCTLRLPIHQWIGGAHRCHTCDLRRLADLINAADTRQRSEE